MTAFRPGGDAPAAEPLAASAVGGGVRAVPDATLIDLSAERRARASPSQTLEQAIEAVDRQIAALMAEPDGPDKLRASAGLFREKASLLGKRDRALAAEAKEAKRAATQPAARGRPTAEEAAAAEAALHADIRRLLARHDLHYVEATDCWWKLGASGAWTPMKEHAVRLIAAPMRDPEYFAEFCEVMRADGRWYEAMTASFRPQPPHVLNTLRPDFCPLVEGGGEPHEMFGHLIASLGGGKAENIEHIERLLLAKYLNPANHLLPALVIDDPEGGAGKGLFVSNLLPTVFGAALVADNLSMADITGRFTAHTAGKAIVYVNEFGRGPGRRQRAQAGAGVAHPVGRAEGAPEVRGRQHRADDRQRQRRRPGQHREGARASLGGLRRREDAEVRGGQERQPGGERGRDGAEQ